MSSNQEATRRASRLKALFRDVLAGSRPVRASVDAKLFLEAIQNSQPPGSCVETIIASKSGVSAVRDAVRVDLSSAFALSHALPFLRYLSDPGVKALADGQLLQQLLLAIAHPPTVWNMLFNMFLIGNIPHDQLYPFVWLALQLVSLPRNTEVDVLSDVQIIVGRESLLKAESHETRELGYKIKHVLQLRVSPGQGLGPQIGGPGGRHDNDHANFRDIQIYPTTDELLSTQPPYYQTVREVFDTDLPDRTRVHLDNQFRLLREDMLGELREDIQVATGKKKGKRKALALGGLVPVSINVGDESMGRFKKCCLAVECYDGLEFLEDMDLTSRQKFLKVESSFLKHQTFGVLCRGNECYGFAFIDRDADLLAKSPPVVLLQFTDYRGLHKALLALQVDQKTAKQVQFILIDTPVFAYEPVLNGLKELTELPLHDPLFNPAAAELEFNPPEGLKNLVLTVQERGTKSLRLAKSGVEFDSAQTEALLSALTRRVSLIQGPPGTGKSFIGAHIAKCIHRFSTCKILVISYTNHALNQFLEDLTKAGIPENDIVRIGSKAKCTPATLPLLLTEQTRLYRRAPTTWNIINDLKSDAGDSADELKTAFSHYQQLSISWADISEHLEFSADDRHFYEALLVPVDKGGWRRAGGQGKRVGPSYLYQRWRKGEDAGIFKDVAENQGAVWAMTKSVREGHLERWTRTMVEERLGAIDELARQYNNFQERIETQFGENNVHILKSKRIIGCTTTAAAKYSRIIRAASPDVILVEEAGEILESHILTAMAPTVKQLILIGDHKQLRPKVNNYALTVERGDGFDLNRSLFERMIMQGAPHTTLCKQHRMVPEISIFPRELTYPELHDGPKTSGRPAIIGLQDRVVFLNHGKMEDIDSAISDRRDAGTKASKKNRFEAEMALRCLKYLGQQGYKSDQIVILTPYLGQVRELTEVLRRNQHDPEISELDRFELIRAGLLSQAAAKLDRKPVRVSTIDNYQGEESDIVIASLTRSNESGDIGFMAAPERLNVLITRARDCLLLIGNMETFMQSKKGRETWHPFFELLKREGHLYDGLPVKCERHPDRTALLKEPVDFAKSCPDGGCSEVCGATLKCGIHKCKSRCHRITDHTKIPCSQLQSQTCPRQHTTRVPCSRQPRGGCSACASEDREAERQARRDLAMEVARAQRQEAYAARLRAVREEIESRRREARYEEEEREQGRELEAARGELAALERARVVREKRGEGRGGCSPGGGGGGGDDGPVVPGTARADWEHMKEFEGAGSRPLDELMGMIGLEEVKREFLSIKIKVDTALRQGVSLDSERFGCSLLGNPGTGKTTVARLYAAFLTDAGIIPGTTFKETTGSGLANLGVAGTKKLLDDLLNSGGGVLLIDEAYQLTSGNSPGGRGVLDFLLAEVERLTGKVVFVLAGYARQMEGLFAHNPGLPGRFPVEMAFADYDDDELRRILELGVAKKYGGRMRVDGGVGGLCCRVVARRIGRGRGKEGFANARAVQNVLARISRRQADRLQRERRAGAKPDDFLFTKEDMIGPKPAEALEKCAAWRKLRELVGLGAVKDAVQALVDSIQQNYQRELDEQPPIEYSLNKVFLGNPGTGKTTIAKLYGEILVALGLLSKGEVVTKNSSDFVGAALGQSEQQTKGILAATVGKVLVIDEAYGLYGGGGAPGSTSDPYKTAVIDTIVADVQSVPGDDRCVLLLGYKDQMETMFQNVNPGLSRRFPIASAFTFEDFSDEELGKILDLKLKNQGYRATGQARGVAMDMLCRARNRPNFGNAGEIDIILDTAKARHQTRLSKAKDKAAAADNVLQAQDFDGDFDRADRAETNIRKLFEGTVGSDQLVAQLEGYQSTARTTKALGLDPREGVPFNFLFRGPPGTGKTTTARKMGKVFYDMGFLAAADVVECSATDLVGQFVGQTGPKVQQVLDRALGRVLFVDEAYRLAEGHFAREAVDELVDSVTKERYHKKLIIILAGYDTEINRLMAVNPGLASRFPEAIDFRALAPEECVTLLIRVLDGRRTVLGDRGVELDLSALEAPTTSFAASVRGLFAALAVQEGWANARDVITLAQGVFNDAIRSKEGIAAGRIPVRGEAVVEQLKAMLAKRQGQSGLAASLPRGMQDAPVDLGQLARRPADTATKIETRAQQQDPVVERELQEDEEDEEYDLVDDVIHPQDGSGSAAAAAKRDAGVSDAVWEQLQRDREAEEKRDEEHRRLEEAARKARGEAREKIVKRLLEEEARRNREAEMRRRLQVSGVCPMGYEWIKQAGGFRCAGGSHFMSDGQLAGLK